MISITIVEDDADFIEIFSFYLKTEERFELLNIFTSAETALREIPKNPPDIVMVDIKLPGINGIDLIKQLKNQLPETQYLVCSSFHDNEIVFEALKNGASGYLLKNATVDEVRSAIIELSEGGAPMSPYIAKKVITLLQTEKRDQNDHKLTNRERQVLNLMARGLLYKEIAAALFISIDTVKNHLKSVYKKMHVQNKTEALNKFNPRNGE